MEKIDKNILHKLIVTKIKEVMDIYLNNMVDNLYEKMDIWNVLMEELCDLLLSIFIHGLAIRTRNSYINIPFDRLKHLFYSITPNEIKLQISRLPVIKDSIDECLAWIRISLNDASLTGFIDIIVNDCKILDEYYMLSAYLRDRTLLNEIITLISQDLLFIQFNLSHQICTESFDSRIKKLLIKQNSDEDNNNDNNNNNIYDMNNSNNNDNSNDNSNNNDNNNNNGLIDNGCHVFNSNNDSLLEEQQLKSITSDYPSSNKPLTSSIDQSHVVSTAFSNEIAITSSIPETVAMAEDNLEIDPNYNLNYTQINDQPSTLIESQLIEDLIDESNPIQIANIPNITHLETPPVNDEMSHIRNDNQIHSKLEFDMVFERSDHSDHNESNNLSDLDEQHFVENQIKENLGLVEDLVDKYDDLTFMGMTFKEELEMSIDLCKEEINKINQSNDLDRSKELEKLVHNLVKFRKKLHGIHQSTNEDMHILTTPTTTDRSVNFYKLLEHHIINVVYDKSMDKCFCDVCTKSIKKSWPFNRPKKDLWFCKCCDAYFHDYCLPSLKEKCLSYKIENLSPITKISPEIGLLKQNYQCPECNHPIDLEENSYSTKCDYNGLHYCKSCFGFDLQTIIPARVIHNWDFTPMKVSFKSYKLLRTINKKIFFSIDSCNPQLLHHIVILKDILDVQTSIIKIFDFVKNCRFALETGILLELLSKNYIVEKPGTFTICDLQLIQSGQMFIKLMDILTELTSHVKLTCMLCNGRGYYCEVCRSDNIIYPFDNHIFSCNKCGSVVHKICYESSNRCMRCYRLEQHKRNS